MHNARTGFLMAVRGIRFFQKKADGVVKAVALPG